MNSQAVDDLLRVLHQESELYSYLRDLSRQKTRLIVEGKVTELENVTKLEQSIVVRLGKLGNTREELIEKLASEMQVEPSEINISYLVEKVEGRQAEELRNYQQEMTGIVNDLKNSNELNSRLIKNSLDFIEFSINLLTEDNSGGINYGSSGTPDSTRKRSLLDIKL